MAVVWEHDGGMSWIRCACLMSARFFACMQTKDTFQVNRVHHVCLFVTVAILFSLHSSHTHTRARVHVTQCLPFANTSLCIIIIVVSSSDIFWLSVTASPSLCAWRGGGRVYAIHPHGWCSSAWLSKNNKAALAKIMVNASSSSSLSSSSKTVIRTSRRTHSWAGDEMKICLAKTENFRGISSLERMLNNRW